jgi:hypothetical protein
MAAISAGTGNEKLNATFSPRLTNEPVCRFKTMAGKDAQAEGSASENIAMITRDEDEQPCRQATSAEWNWYSVERGEQLAAASRVALAQHIGRRLRIIYPVAQIAEEPAAFRCLLAALAADDT